MEQSDSTKFIINGQATPGPGSWPWMCSVGFFTAEVWEHQCGGTLVTYSHVITAAHCLEIFFSKQGREDRIKLRCGDFHLMESTDDGGVQVLDVSRYDMHEGYNFPNYDISVLVMETKFQASNFTRPICLENSTQGDTKDALIVLGRGMDSNGERGMKLNRAKLQIQDPDY